MNDKLEKVHDRLWHLPFSRVYGHLVNRPVTTSYFGEHVTGILREIDVLERPWHARPYRFKGWRSYAIEAPPGQYETVPVRGRDATLTYRVRPGFHPVVMSMTRLDPKAAVREPVHIVIEPDGSRTVQVADTAQARHDQAGREDTIRALFRALEQSLKKQPRSPI